MELELQDGGEDVARVPRVVGRGTLSRRQAGVVTDCRPPDATFTTGC
jgi:hypothetical protein